MSQRFEIRKQRLGSLYGLISGIAFSTTAWGIDAIALASSHVSYPWIKFLPGLIITSLIGGLVGWASVKISKGLVTIILWIVFAMIMVWLTIWIPFISTPYLIKVLQPGLIEWIDYPMVANVNQFRIVAIIVIVLPAIISGLLENILIESVLMSSYKGSILSLIVVCSLIMSLAGFAVDEMTNKHFREPVKVLDDLFKFAIDNQGKEIDKITMRRMRLKTVEDLEQILSSSRKLTLIAFDETLAQMDILVNFKGVWVKCSTIHSQPLMCKQISISPVINIVWK
jgi:hypothetical protein